jgi:hypothetical protein
MGSEYDFGLDMEAASARVESLLENQEMKHDIQFEELSNIEALTLYSALLMGLEEYQRDGNEFQYHILREQVESVREDAQSLFSEMDDITEMVNRNVPEHPAQQNQQSWIKGFLRSPFGKLTGGLTPQDFIWATGVLMIGVMVSVSILNGVLVASGANPLQYENLITGVSAGIGAVGFAFVLGIATGRTTGGPSPP